MITRDSLPRSAAMLQAVEQLRQALTRGGGVLLCGEPGVGRLQFARAIHLAPVRPDGMPVETLLDRAMRNFQSSDRPWIEFDCGSPNGVERELFGCDPNYSAAHGLDRITAASALQFAFGGTLLLKQVSELPGRIQTRLARVFRDGEIVVEHADGTEMFARVVVRPIATLDANGEDRLASPLRVKLSETIIHVPPLRKRREDIPALAQAVLADACESLKLPIKRASRQALALLSALPWKGNVPELRDLMRILALKVNGTHVRQGDVLRHVRLDGGRSTSSYSGSLKEARERFEREYVAAVLEQHHGRMADAAKALGIQRTNLYRKVRQLALRRKAL